MYMKDLLKQIILEQQEILHAQNKRYVQRYIADEWLQTSEILIISGIRRCGKSVLMQQIRDRLVEKDFFFNFDDERLANFKLDDFQKLQECFVELFGEQHTYYFDEIQNIEGWERFVRRLYNAGNKIVITGSNARMLSRELGTHLTGRYIQVEIYPFSFQEYLAMNERVRKASPMVAFFSWKWNFVPYPCKVFLFGNGFDFPKGIYNRTVCFPCSLWIFAVKAPRR